MDFTSVQIVTQELQRQPLKLGEIAAAHRMDPAEVVALAYSCGIAAVGSESFIHAAQVGRLESALRASRSCSLAVAECDDNGWPLFSWNLKKRTLWERGFLESPAAMRAVEKVALASAAVTWLSRQHEKIALRVVRHSLCVWLARDSKSPDRLFIVTAYVSELATPGDHASRFVREATTVDDVVRPADRLRLLPVGRG